MITDDSIIFNIIFTILFISGIIAILPYSFWMAIFHKEEL